MTTKPLLTEFLENAVEVGADAIEMEYASGGGLEVCFMAGANGMGSVLEDRRLIGELISSIVEKAKLTRKERGTFPVSIHGNDYTVFVQVYDSFGENAYRLEIKPGGADSAKKPRRNPKRK
jgi:hypothetical protein